MFAYAEAMWERDREIFGENIGQEKIVPKD